MECFRAGRPEAALQDRRYDGKDEGGRTYKGNRSLIRQKPPDRRGRSLSIRAVSSRYEHFSHLLRAQYSWRRVADHAIDGPPGLCEALPNSYPCCAFQSYCSPVFLANIYGVQQEWRVNFGDRQERSIPKRMGTDRHDQ